MERIAISVKNLNKEVSNKIALDNITFNVHASEILSIVGPKGSSISLLTKALVNLVNIDSGEISYFDHNIKKERNYILNFVGYKMKEFTPWKNTTIDEYFKYSSKFYQGDYYDNALKLCSHFHLSMKRKLKTLDNEELQKISIIDSIYFEPEVIIMDSPFTYLTNDTKDLLIDLLVDLKKKGRAILLTSENLNEVSFSDTIMLMKDSKLHQKEDISKAFLNYKHVVIKSKKEISKDLFVGSKFKNIIYDSYKTSFTYQGDINDLIKILERINIMDINITNPSLEEVYKVLDESN